MAQKPIPDKVQDGEFLNKNKLNENMFRKASILGLYPG